MAGRRWHLAAAAGAFAVSRVVYLLAGGVFFDTRGIHRTWQFLDVALLRADLLESVWLLHSQPPLFNLGLGVALQVFGERWQGGLHVVFLAMGLALTLTLAHATHRLGAPRWAAAATATVWAVSPAAALYEHYLFYPLPEALLAVLVVYAAARFGRRGSVGAAAGLFSAAAVLALTRSMFHLVWLLGLLAGLTWLTAPERRRALLVGATLPLVLVTAWYAKNAVLVGDFTASTWDGMNLARIAVGALPDDERRQLAERGVLTGLSEIGPFHPPRAYDPWTADCPPPLGGPAADATTKSSGEPNYNWRCYVGVSDLFLAESARAVRADPAAYLHTVGRGVWQFFRPSTAYFGVQDTLDETAVRAERLLALQVLPEGASLTALLAYVGAMVAGGVWALRRGAEPGLRLAGATAVALLGWIAAAGVLFEFGEAERFRFTTQPVVLLVLAVALARTVAGTPRRRTAEEAP